MKTYKLMTAVSLCLLWSMGGASSFAQDMNGGEHSVSPGIVNMDRKRVPEHFTHDFIFDEEDEFSSPLVRGNPGRAVNSLAAKANEWQEPSKRSEERYVQAMRAWLDSLPPKQRDKAREILLEEQPGLHALRVAIRDKKSQLATLSFGKNTRPEILPRLGQQLQQLRNALIAELKKVGDRLRDEAGVVMEPLGEDGFWLAPPDNEKRKGKDPSRSEKFRKEAVALGGYAIMRGAH